MRAVFFALALGLLGSAVARGNIFFDEGALRHGDYEAAILANIPLIESISSTRPIRIFDTDLLADTITDDTDLQAPLENMDTADPNDTISGLGNVAILQNPSVGFYDSNPANLPLEIQYLAGEQIVSDARNGGTITFTLANPIAIESVGLIDIDVSQNELATFFATDSLGNDLLGEDGFEVMSFGNKSFKSFALDLTDVKTFSVEFSSSGALAFVNIPEPSTWALIISGLLGVGVLVLHRRRCRA